MSKYDRHVFRIYQALNEKMPDGSVALHLGSPYVSDKEDPESIFYEPYDEAGIGFNSRLGEFLNKQVYPGNARRHQLYDTRRKGYNELNAQRQKDVQKRSQDFIYNNFEIDPETIISDEAKKHIYRDLSSWYNNDRRGKNIASALTTGDNRWR